MNNLKFKGKIFNSKEIETLYHVGTMDIANKSRYSLEGNGLSVSICPKEWIKIARMSSYAIWSLYKKDIKILDYYSLTENDFQIATNWGVEQGYLKECIAYKSIKFDDEMDCDLEMMHDTFEEACEEACFDEEYLSYEEYQDFKEYEYSKVEKIVGYEPTIKLKKISMVDVDISNSQEINLLIFLEKNTDLDGVYWDEVLDVTKYSAPRGVIFNSKVNTFSRKEIFFCEDCETRIAEYEVNDRKICDKCMKKKYSEDKFNPDNDHYTCSKCGNEYFFGFGKCNCYKVL